MMIYVGDSSVGRNIRYLRRKKYISCKKLARLCGMEYRMLHLIEKGILRDIGHDQITRLCCILETDQEALLKKDGKL